MRLASQLSQKAGKKTWRKCRTFEGTANISKLCHPANIGFSTAVLLQFRTSAASFEVYQCAWVSGCLPFFKKPAPCPRVFFHDLHLSIYCILHSVTIGHILLAPNKWHVCGTRIDENPYMSSAQHCLWPLPQTQNRDTLKATALVHYKVSGVFYLNSKTLHTHHICALTVVFFQRQSLQRNKSCSGSPCKRPFTGCIWCFVLSFVISTHLHLITGRCFLRHVNP